MQLSFGYILCWIIFGADINFGNHNKKEINMSPNNFKYKYNSYVLLLIKFLGKFASQIIIFRHQVKKKCSCGGHRLDPRQPQDVLRNPIPRVDDKNAALLYVAPVSAISKALVSFHS